MGGGGNRWVRPEIQHESYVRTDLSRMLLLLLNRTFVVRVYPIVAVMATAIGMNVFCVARNLLGHPDIRISKEDRASGYPENFKEGKKYKYHPLREYALKQEIQIMPRINAALGALKKDK